MPLKHGLGALDSIQWAFRQLFARKVVGSVIIPCCIHSFILVGFLFLIYDFASGFLFGLAPPELPAQLSWANNVVAAILKVLTWIVLIGILLGGLVFGLSAATAVAHFIASPFNGWLSSIAENELRPTQHPEQDLKAAFVNGLAREVQRLKYWFIRALGLGFLTIVCFWIPVVNSLVGFMWTAFGAWMIGLQAVDYVADNNGYNFQQTLVICKKARFDVMLLGGAIMGMMIVPGLNLISMAISVLAGTYLWVKWINK